MNYPAFEQAFSVAALHRAFLRALRGHRKDPAAALFAVTAGARLCALSRAVLADAYVPGPLRAFEIRDPKPRTVVVVPFVDRVVHHAFVAAVEPVVDAFLSPEVFACRKDKGLHRAIARAQALLRSHRYVLQLDIAKYFERLPHATLLAILEHAPFSLPPRYLALLATILRFGVAPGAVVGIPIGALTSQLFGNVGLFPLDAWLAARAPAVAHVRYMDDVLVFGPRKALLWAVHAAVGELVAALGLALKARATRIVPATEGVSFLGWQVYAGALHLAARDRRRLGRAIRKDSRWLWRVGARRGRAALVAWTQGAPRRRAATATRLLHAGQADTTLAYRRALVWRYAAD